MTYRSRLTVDQRVQADVYRRMQGTPNRATVWWCWQLASVFCHDYTLRMIEPRLARHASARLTARFAADALTNPDSTYLPAWESWQYDLAVAILTNPRTSARTRRFVWDNAYARVSQNLPSSANTTAASVGRFRRTVRRDANQFASGWTALANTLHATAVAYPDEFADTDAQQAQALLFLHVLTV